jgi:putative transposase
MPQYIRAFVPGDTFCFTVYNRHVDYIHYNPVNHSHVARVADWPYSSFQRYVECGIYNLEWAADDNIRSLEME